MIVRNEWFTISHQNQLVYITVIAPGFQLKELEPMLQANPRIVIKNFMALRGALQSANGDVTEIGVLRDDIEVSLSRDKMEAKVRIYLPQDQVLMQPREILAQVLGKLKQSSVTEGILVEVFQNGLRAGEEIVIAKGIEPIDGLDAVITYYQIPEKRPTIRHDGNADFYEMNFISLVKKDEWLGEKQPPQEGTPGKTVTGEHIPAKPGKDKILIYDRKTVYEAEENGKIVLRAKVEGAVTFKSGKLCVENHLIIPGDVGPDTGNIDFKGSVTVHGTVHDGYSVVADLDISILGNLGLGSVEKIESRCRDIYIKGGVFGKEKALIKAARDVFLKHTNDCTVQAGNSIHIGFYSIGSKLEAKNVILDQKRGKVVGGEIVAQVQVVAAEIGNKLERPTHVQVEGFDRGRVKQELDHILKTYKESLQEIECMKRELEIYEMYSQKLEGDQLQEFEKYKERYEEMVSNLDELEETRRRLMEYLATKGEGQVTIFERVYPKTKLKLKQVQEYIDRVTTGTFYVMGNHLYMEK